MCCEQACALTGETRHVGEFAIVVFFSFVFFPGGACLKGADVRGVTQFGMVIGAWIASCAAVAVVDCPDWEGERGK